MNITRKALWDYPSVAWTIGIKPLVTASVDRQSDQVWSRSPTCSVSYRFALRWVWKIPYKCLPEAHHVHLPRILMDLYLFNPNNRLRVPQRPDVCYSLK
ncbi:hypothetical protein BDV27DRAFT_100467 [Aspergillus caelatus]|uniref:Uncharacterized protein n=1 Tax=Aspergillus caelatus TaxID=61420 RepID=A0A5N7A9B0_9EURO|nr:uncharacterized protein BDV27DRAFT_100467 [Aspergillus caelatus]KAE8365716.1 hypothetical protein BDV27DRAFT_100467 [Aspergillus caelatus]